MKRSYLIQRLQKPFAKAATEKGELMHSLVNAFSFGGGLVNGGMPKEGIRLIKDIFRFDYMGSAEFEFGAVPKTFATILDHHKKYIAFDVDIPYKYKSWGGPDFVGTEKVYVICEKDWKEEVIQRLKKFATKPCYGETKERVSLDEAMSGGSAYNKDLCGWLELDNGYMFFIDEKMFTQTKLLFGIEI